MATETNHRLLPDPPDIENWFKLLKAARTCDCQHFVRVYESIDEEWEFIRFELWDQCEKCRGRNCIT